MVVKELKPLFLASLVCLAGHPLFGLTDAGKQLLEQLRHRSFAPQPVESPAEQLSVPAPVLVPPPAETVTPVPEPEPAVAGEPAPEPEPADQPKVSAPPQQGEKTRGRRDKADRRKSTAVAPAVVPVATEPFRLKPPLTPAAAPATAALPGRQGKTGPAAPLTAAPLAGHRTFGEISDEELVQFAQEYVWRPEKSKKHNPPPTPPYRPKKKDTAAKPAAKPVAKTAAKPDAKPPAAVTKASGKAPAPASGKSSKKTKTASGKGK
ncbi:MAG: hypothetical protein GX442_10735 [Candidatus Riflebacteria bacterium]|nr:hypothetical protein [Candidatus Riflebacteria bacterium]